jgi:hypothetical protein
MIDRNRKSRRTAGFRGQPGSAEDSPKAKRRRHRLPVHARLSLDDSLPANERHPLAQSAPEFRAASRVRLIAGILARLAQAAARRLD